MKSYLKNLTNQWQKNLKEEKCVRFKDNNWAADLAEVGSLLSKTQGVKFHKICMG